MVDTVDSKSTAEKRPGSSPGWGTKSMASLWQILWGPNSQVEGSIPEGAAIFANNDSCGGNTPWSSVQ